MPTDSLLTLCQSQWTLIFATGLAAISTFAVVASSIQLQNTFGASAEAVEAWDVTKTLRAKLLDAYGYLVRRRLERLSFFRSRDSEAYLQRCIF